MYDLSEYRELNLQAAIREAITLLERNYELETILGLPRMTGSLDMSTLRKRVAELEAMAQFDEPGT